MKKYKDNLGNDSRYIYHQKYLTLYKIDCLELLKHEIFFLERCYSSTNG